MDLLPVAEALPERSPARREIRRDEPRGFDDLLERAQAEPADAPRESDAPETEERDARAEERERRARAETAGAELAASLVTALSTVSQPVPDAGAPTLPTVAARAVTASPVEPTAAPAPAADPTSAEPKAEERKEEARPSEKPARRVEDRDPNRRRFLVASTKERDLPRRAEPDRATRPVEERPVVSSTASDDATAPAPAAPASPHPASRAQAAPETRAAAPIPAPDPISSTPPAAPPAAPSPATEAPVPAASPAHRPEPASPAWAAAESILRQIRVHLRPGAAELRLRLDPPGLGELRIRFVYEDRRLRARVEASEPTTAALLRDREPELRAAMRQAGIDVADLDLASDGGGHAAADARDARESRPERRRPDPPRDARPAEPTPSRATARAGALDLVA